MIQNPLGFTISTALTIFLADPTRHFRHHRHGYISFVLVLAPYTDRNVSKGQVYRVGGCIAREGRELGAVGTYDDCQKYSSFCNVFLEKRNNVKTCIGLVAQSSVAELPHIVTIWYQSMPH